MKMVMWIKDGKIVVYTLLHHKGEKHILSNHVIHNNDVLL